MPGVWQPAGYGTRDSCYFGGKSDINVPRLIEDVAPRLNATDLMLVQGVRHTC